MFNVYLSVGGLRIKYNLIYCIIKLKPLNGLHPGCDCIRHGPRLPRIPIPPTHLESPILRTCRLVRSIFTKTVDAKDYTGFMNSKNKIFDKTLYKNLFYDL